MTTRIVQVQDLAIFEGVWKVPDNEDVIPLHSSPIRKDYTGPNAKETPKTFKNVVKCQICNVRLCVTCFNEFHTIAQRSYMSYYIYGSV